MMWQKKKRGNDAEEKERKKENLHSCTDLSTGNNFQHESHKHLEMSTDFAYEQTTSDLCIWLARHISGCMCKINVIMWQKWTFFYSVVFSSSAGFFFSALYGFHRSLVDRAPYINILVCITPWSQWRRKAKRDSAVSCFCCKRYNINPCKWFSSALQQL